MSSWMSAQQVPPHILWDPNCQAHRCSRRCLSTRCVSRHDDVPLFISPRDMILYHLQQALLDLEPG